VDNSTALSAVSPTVCRSGTVLTLACRREACHDCCSHSSSRARGRHRAGPVGRTGACTPDEPAAAPVRTTVEQIWTTEGIQQLEKMYENPINSLERSGDTNSVMAGFYIWNNTGIGLQCFAWGLLVVPGMLVTMFNAIKLGAAFGYMARPDVAAGTNFLEFVTAHGPFELTAIILMAGAGLRLGLSWMMTKGLTRGAALRKAGRQVMPIVGAAMVMFFLAALIEGFVSPSAAPYPLKIAVALFSSGLLAVYFIVLGFPNEGPTSQNRMTNDQ